MLGKELERQVAAADFGSIARRLFVMNGFDGALTLLGIITGSFMAGITNPAYVIGSGLGACLAMGISGMTGAYLTESAERERELKNLEKAMLKDLRGSIHGDAARTIPILTAIVDGLSPALAGSITLLPFFFGFNIEMAYVLGIAFNMGTLFLLGIYLGRVSEQNKLLNGTKMLIVGLVTALILGFIGAF
ncbi:MAG: VIT1/CCC1 transporter family protein [Candidatus Heimdallarchaeota archaeon]